MNNNDDDKINKILTQQNARISKLMEKIGEVQKNQENIILALEELLYSIPQNQTKNPASEIIKEKSNINWINKLLLDKEGKRDVN